jgi:hypothetical protein
MRHIMSEEVMGMRRRHRCFSQRGTRPAHQRGALSQPSPRIALRSCCCNTCTEDTSKEGVMAKRQF